MNIFYLHPDPSICAKYHVDKHCVKMIVEYAQLLSTAHRILDGLEQQVRFTPIKVIYGECGISIKSGKEKVKTYLSLHHIDPYMDSTLYRHTHANHPSSIWVRECLGNYLWLYELFVALTKEYTFRYGRSHKTETLIPYLAMTPKNICPNPNRSDPTPAMDDKFKRSSVLESYHNYYLTEKRPLLTWKNRPVPDFVKLSA